LSGIDERTHLETGLFLNDADATLLLNRDQRILGWQRNDPNMALSSKERLNRFYQQFLPNDQVLVVISADPDAIASAMAVKRLLWRRVAGVTLTHVNVIDRPDNQAMVRLLKTPLVHIGRIKLQSFTRFVLVDSQPDHNELFSRIQPHILIDHHPDTGVRAPFTDIRPQYGATASIMVEYLRAAKITPSAKLATALFHAIKVDTNNFERKTLPEDLRAFQYLFKFTNIYLARKIERAQMKLDYLKYFKSALENRRLKKGKVFVYLGPVVNPDVCVLIADFFMGVDRITWSIVSGVWQDKLVLIFRNDGIRKDAGKVAKQSFGPMGTAGGHKSMARAEIPISELQGGLDLKNNKRVLAWIIKKTRVRK
jgi:nanoRNase/pAp phosphatase (c-di-AMP/oligoRNAs hydrolase)